MDAPTLCAHLRPLVDALLRGGARVEAIDSGWTKAQHVLTLSEGLNADAAKREARAHGLEFWQNNDSHYSIEYGWFCVEHKHAVSWPQDKAAIRSL